ncbi:hypothetical protein GCM10027162_01900 [Streptomyces incanus]
MRLGHDFLTREWAFRAEARMDQRVPEEWCGTGPGPVQDGLVTGAGDDPVRGGGVTEPLPAQKMILIIAARVYSRFGGVP